MERITYVRPADVDEAVKLLNEPGQNNFVLAGGTDLMLIFKMEKKLSGRLVDISTLPELHKISRKDDIVTFGSAATFDDVLHSPIIQETALVLVQACRQVGATQIRNMGTVGGNVANAAACADSIPALVCLNATAAIRTTNGVQTIPVSELITGPNKTKIPAGGLITSFQYRVPAAGSRSTFLKLGRRNAMAISRLTVAVLGSLSEDNLITEARFVTGSATPQICRLKVVEDYLIGKSPSIDLIQGAAQLAVDEMIRLAGKRWSSEFKMPALTAMTTQALFEVFRVEVPRLVTS